MFDTGSSICEGWTFSWACKPVDATEMRYAS